MDPRTAAPRTVDHIDALPPGTRLGEFEITALLGVGGFGMVYQAFDHSLLRFVAIKEYMPAALAGRAQGHSLWVRSSSHASSFEAGLASFVGEARLLAQFDHPSLVKVFRFWEANRTAYMVMPLYSGMTLKQARAHMRTPPSEAWLRQVLWSVTSALRVLHDGQTLHRDVSPDNIFLQDSGPPVLLDLGAARRAITQREGHHTAVLKVNYAPIEQYADAGGHLREGPWSDLYALGAVVHGCLCNDAPLPATLRAIRDRMVPFTRVARTVRKQFGVEYSRPFVEAVSQCLALQPADRPQSVDALLQTMDLSVAPADLEHFDFRAELGDNWVEPASADAPGVALTSLLYPSALSQPLGQALPAVPQAMESSTAFAETVVADWGLSQVSAAPQSAAQAASAPQMPSERPRGAIAARLRWGAAAALLLTTLAAGWAWQGTRKPPRTPESEIITEFAPQPAAAPAPQSAPEPLPAAGDEPSSSAAEAASAPALSASAVTEAAPAARARPARPAPAPPSVAPAPAAPAPAAPAPPPPAPAPPAPPPPRPAPAVVAGPSEACASASFLARPLCVHQQCQKAALAAHPECVALRRRQEEEARQRQLYPQ